MKAFGSALKLSSTDICMVELDQLKEHEQTEARHLERLKKRIRCDGILKISIAVDKKTNVVIDGHYRLNALKQLGAKRIPVTYFDYQSNQIKVKTWRKNETVTKKQVIEAGLNGNRFPPKTSRHMIEKNGKLVHISKFEKRVNIPLNKLK